jgi:outer membrane receptor for ferric coprogen and ferric-rhodotorulic acid
MTSTWTYSGIANSDLLLNFRQDLGQNFDIKVTLGNNIYSSYSKYLYSDADGLEIADFYQLSNSATNTTSAGVSNYRTFALFGDVNIAFRNIVYLGLTGRNDWSTTMPEANLSAFYPSVSLGLVFTELEAFKSNNLYYPTES